MLRGITQLMDSLVDGRADSFESQVQMVRSARRRVRSAEITCEEKRILYVWFGFRKRQLGWSQCVEPMRIHGCRVRQRSQSCERHSRRSIQER
ncbi:hypothetical protein CEXT_737251 [Caerostris extrusa]|uniref:Uncharacterized protein n=1 Tax=Caerostris extrusa TaxID=172846 RepID=A0AAV4WUN7_CAEEX|nr:hypothetical protein CEXT_737251 [Caerostris extrusa]